MKEAARDRLRIVFEATQYEWDGYTPVDAVRLACSRNNLLKPDELEPIQFLYEACCVLFAGDWSAVPRSIEDETTRPIIPEGR